MNGSTSRSAWDSRGTGNGQFHVPVGIAVGVDDGNIFVANTDEDQIKKFAPA